MSNAKIPAAYYHAIAGLFARIHNNGLSLPNVLRLMESTLGKAGEAEFADLAGWTSADIQAAASRSGVSLVPARLTRVMQAIAFINPTTPLCPASNCREFTITNETGPWQVIPPGRSCPVCNEYIRPSTVVTKRVNWTTGLEVEIAQHFDRSYGAEPIPLTTEEIKNFLMGNDIELHRQVAQVLEIGLAQVDDALLRLANTLSCHPDFTGKFPSGPLQVLSALGSPLSVGLARNDLIRAGELARERWWTKGQAAPVISVAAPTVPTALAPGTALIVGLYANAASDKELIEEFRSHIRPLLRRSQGKIVYWDMSMIKAGAVLEEELFAKLQQATMILPFLSSRYLADPLIAQVEEYLKAQRPHTSCIPINLFPCMIAGTMYANKRAVPEAVIGSVRSNQRDSLWVEVASALGRQLLPG
jgi:hypothetical protein